MILSKTKLIIFSIIVSLFISNVAYASPIEDNLIKQDIVMQNIINQQQELDRLSNEYNEAIIKQEEIKQNINKTESQIKILEQRLQHNQQKLEAEAVYEYKYGKIPIMNVFTDSNNFQEFVVNLDYCNKIMTQTNNTIKENQELKNNLIQEKEKLIKEKNDLQGQLDNINTAKQEAENCIQNLENEYAQLSADIATLIIQQQVATPLSTVLNNTQIDDPIIENPTTWLTTGTVAQNFMSITNPITTQIEEQNITENTTTANDINTVANSDIVSRAYSMLGSPYSWGGTTSSGFDCSGFVSYCLTGEEGTRLGTTGTFIGWEQVSDPQPGDVCVVHNDSSQHTGIYVGDGKMVHAATYGVGVVEGNVQPDMIYVRYNE